MLITKATTHSFTGSAAEEMPRDEMLDQLQVSLQLDSPRRVGRNGLIFILFLLVFATATGCVSNILINGLGDCGPERCLMAIEMENARFEPRPAGPPVPLQPGLTYWLKKGDQAVARYDTYELHWQRMGVPMCLFAENPWNHDCSVCDLCNPPQDRNGPPCFSTNWNLDTNTMVVVVNDGFDTNSAPRQVLDYPLDDYLRGCTQAVGTTTNPLTNTPILFTPDTSGTYRLLADATDASQVAETRFHVISGGTNDVDRAANAKTVSQQLMRPSDTGQVDGKDYWTWAVEGDPKLLENFSPNLRVTNIRIRRGRCVRDSNSGLCVTTGETPLVRPSRVLFLPNYEATVSGNSQERRNRCYSYAGGQDGYYLNLADCRNTLGATSPSPRYTTPTYDPDNPAVTNSSLQKLTWFVEFDTSEGGDSIQPNEELFIEFTIEANP